MHVLGTFFFDIYVYVCGIGSALGSVWSRLVSSDQILKTCQSFIVLN